MALSGNQLTRLGPMGVARRRLVILPKKAWIAEVASSLWHKVQARTPAWFTKAAVSDDWTQSNGKSDDWDKKPDKSDWWV